jgi:D-aspartate ligase
MMASYWWLRAQVLYGMPGITVTRDPAGAAMQGTSADQPSGVEYAYERAARVEKMEPTPAFILSGHTMALGVVRALGEMGVPIYVGHYDPRDIAHLSRYVTKRFRTPHPEAEERALIEFLLTEIADLGPTILFPVSDEALVAVSRHKEALARHFTVACPDWTITRMCIDKGLTYKLAEEVGVPAPRTLYPKTTAEVEDFARTARYPYLVKPKESHRFYERFKTKMFVVRSADGMIAGYRRAAAAALEVVLQEVVPGPDALVVNYNCYVANGRAVAEFTAEHTRNGPPGFGSPRVAMSRSFPELLEPGRRLLGAMGFNGYACVEFKKDPRDQIYRLMEVNGRHNLSTLLAVRCGINFPYLEYRHRAYGEEVAAQTFKRDVYWIDLPRDLGFTISYRKQERYSWRDWLRPYRNPHVFAILDYEDPLPFLRRICFLVWSAVWNSLRMRRTGRPAQPTAGTRNGP